MTKIKHDSPKSKMSTLQKKLTRMCTGVKYYVHNFQERISRPQINWAGCVPVPDAMHKISQDRTVPKVTKIKECGTQIATKKTDKTESVHSPSGCSAKPVSALQAKLANGKLSVFNVNRSVPRKPASSGRAGKLFEGLGQNSHEKPQEAFKGTSQHHCHNPG